MFKKAVICALTAVSAILAAPTPAVPSNTDVLNFALTLEHLENTFYAQALAKYTAQDFENDGLPAWVRGRFEQILTHEATHVQFLTAALGDKAVKPCEYALSAPPSPMTLRAR